MDRGKGELVIDFGWSVAILRYGFGGRRAQTREIGCKHYISAMVGEDTNHGIIALTIEGGRE